MKNDLDASYVVHAVVAKSDMRETQNQTYFAKRGKLQLQVLLDYAKEKKKRFAQFGIFKCFITNKTIDYEHNCAICFFFCYDKPYNKWLIIFGYHFWPLL